MVIHMDQRTLAYINLYAILGSLVWLCEFDLEAKRLIEGKDISVGLAVKDGPAATLSFKDGKCTFTEGVDKCDIKLPFSTCEKFNGMIDGTVTPFPSKGLLKIKFLTGEFSALTKILEKYLRATPEDLKNRAFFIASTNIMFHLVVNAVAQVANEDKVGRASAGYIVDGNIKLGIDGGPTAYFDVRNHRLTAVHKAPEKVMSYMEFADIDTARALFDGKVNAVVCVGEGKVRVGGMVSQIDNLNRILDRVPVYLA